MARDFYTHGEVMVGVKGMTGSGISDFTFLGLADKQIKMIFNFHHQQLIVNDFGTRVPAGMMTDLVDAYVEMTLVQFDRSILEICWGEAQGGWYQDTGKLQGAGVILDGGAERFADGWRYISLNLSATVQALPSGGSDGFNGTPWRFYKTYICEPPVEWPIGNNYSIVKVKWHAIPYQTPTDTTYGGAIPEYIGQGTILYDHGSDA